MPDQPPVTPTLLLADDSHTMQRVIEMTFADQGIAVVSVADGHQAVAMLESRPPDIALISVSLPAVDGYTVASLMQQQPALRGRPVLLLAGAFDVIDDGRVRQSGAAGVLVKPLEPGPVIRRVKELLGMSAPAAAAPESRPFAPGRFLMDGPVTGTRHDSFGETGAAARPAPSGAPANEHGPVPPAPFGRSGKAFAPVAAFDQPGFNVDEEWSHEEPPAGSTRDARDGDADAHGALPAGRGAAESFLPADAFALLLAEEQGEAVPALAAPSLELSGSAIELIADRVADRIADRLAEGVLGESLRRTVADVSERLVREEIQRIRSTAAPRNNP